MKGAIALRKPVLTMQLDTSGSNITTAAWRQLLSAAQNLAGCSGLEIFNPSGSSILIAAGGVGSEVAFPITIIPGGTPGIIPLEILKGVRISAKAVDTTMSSGLWVMNFYG